MPTIELENGRRVNFWGNTLPDGTQWVQLSFKSDNPQEEIAEIEAALKAYLRKK